jgi:hypothetical protein
MSYWVIRHKVLDTYLKAVPVKWSSDIDQALTFQTEQGATMVITALEIDGVALEVSAPLKALTIVIAHQLQHHQGSINSRLVRDQLQSGFGSFER